MLNELAPLCAGCASPGKRSQATVTALGERNADLCGSAWYVRTPSRRFAWQEAGHLPMFEPITRVLRAELRIAAETFRRPRRAAAELIGPVGTAAADDEIQPVTGRVFLYFSAGASARSFSHWLTVRPMLPKSPLQP